MLFAHTPDDDDTPATPPAGPSAGVVDAEERKKREKNLEDWKILPKHIQKFYDKDSWFTEQAAKCVPAKQGAYSDEQRADREMVWTDQLKEYNGIQGFIDHFDNLLKEIDDPAFNPQGAKWKDQFQSVFAGFENLKDVEGFHFSEKTWKHVQDAKNKALNEKKSVIRADIQDIISSFIQVRADILENLEKQMQRDLQDRLEYLKDRWENATPRGYENVKGNWLELIGRGMKDVDGLPALLSKESKMDKDKDKKVEAYKAVWEYLTRLEDLYESAQQGKEYEFSMDGLLKEYAELEKDPPSA